MKTFFSWLLLSIATLQGVVSHLYVEVRHLVEIEHRMDEEEAAIAADLKEEAGVEAAIQILQEGQLTPRGYIYSDFFAFSKNVGDETIYFTLSKDSSEVCEQVSQEPLSPRQEEERTASLLKQLFQEFTVPQPELPEFTACFIRTANFAVISFQHQYWSFLDSPPPDVA
ncbi:MAG: hypothetical protein RI973_313 [Bacteroidota bacterium]|jgi:cell division protein YceG involved in septum cleavage